MPVSKVSERIYYDTILKCYSNDGFGEIMDNILKENGYKKLKLCFICWLKNKKVVTFEFYDKLGRVSVYVVEGKKVVARISNNY